MDWEGIDVSITVTVDVDGDIAVDVTVDVVVVDDEARAEAWIAWITANGTVMSPLAGIWPSPCWQHV